MQDGAGTADQTVGGRTGVTVIDGSRLADGAWTFGYVDLSKFNGKTVNIGFEAEIRSFFLNSLKTKIFKKTGK